MTETTDIPVITVDGPSGTGKGTLCGILASWLGWHLLDSGALYRIVAAGAMKHSLDFADKEALAELALRLDVAFSPPRPGQDVEVFFEGEEVSHRIRNEECGHFASLVAAYPEVRAALLQRQRDFREMPGLIADGRDMGTVVFPDANLKFYLGASPEIRAKRRYEQLKEKGIGVNLAQLSADIAERDARDSEREQYPRSGQRMMQSLSIPVTSPSRKWWQRVSQIAYVRLSFADVTYSDLTALLAFKKARN